MFCKKSTQLASGWGFWRAFLPTYCISSVQFSRSVLSDSLSTPWIAASQASLSITNSRSLPKLMSINSVMPSSHLILCPPLLLLPPISPSIRVSSNESTLQRNKSKQKKHTRDWASQNFLSSYYHLWNILSSIFHWILIFGWQSPLVYTVLLDSFNSPCDREVSDITIL